MNLITEPCSLYWCEMVPCWAQGEMTIVGMRGPPAKTEPSTKELRGEIGP